MCFDRSNDAALRRWQRSIIRKSIVHFSTITSIQIYNN